MKRLNKICIYTAFVMIVTLLLPSCEKADEEFVHDTNTISQMVCKATQGGGEFIGKIYEYNKDEQQVEAPFTQDKVEGGYGLIVFEIPMSLKKDVDLTNVFLLATLTYDEIVTPTLSGKHDITGEGIIITVKSGVGTTRRYRVRGEYV